MKATKARIYEGTGSAIDDYRKRPLQTVDKATDINWGIFDKNNQQHKTILSQMRTLQWTTSHERWGEVADINRLSDFLKSDKSPVKKPLKDMESAEVSKIIECFKSMVTKKYK